MTGGGPPDAAAVRAPSMRRRLACFLYEGVLLFGVVMVAGLAVRHADRAAPCAAGQRRAAGVPVRRAGRLLHLVLVARRPDPGDEDLAHPGRTPPTGGRRVARALQSRYVASWLWFLPALASAHAGRPAQRRRSWSAWWLPAWLAYALLAACARAPVLHDVLCGTRLVDIRQAPAPPAQLRHDAPHKGRTGLRSHRSRRPAIRSHGLRLPSATKAPFARSAGWPRCCCRRPSGSAAAGSRWRCWPAR